MIPMLTFALLLLFRYRFDVDVSAERHFDRQLSGCRNINRPLNKQSPIGDASVLYWVGGSKMKTGEKKKFVSTPTGLTQHDDVGYPDLTEPVFLAWKIALLVALLLLPLVMLT